MNCDEAFDALTDPTESNHSALKWHLEFCRRCREMQEVLAPALAMFSGETCGSGDSHSTSLRRMESATEAGSRIRDVETSDRPRSKPFLTPDAVRVAEETARTLHPLRKRGAIRWIMASMVCLMTVLGVFFAMNSADPGTSRGSNSTMLADHCLWTERDAAQTQTPAEKASSRWVVLSCVACHLEDSLD
jgi:hypothetical protein